MIQQTSMEAWIMINKTGKLNANQTIVYDVFKNSDPMPLSNRQIANILQWSINRVTPRVLELRKLNKIVIVSQQVDIYSGVRVNVYALPETVRKYDHYDKVGGVIF